MTQVQHYDLFGKCYYNNLTAAAHTSYKSASGAEKEELKKTLIKSTLRPIDYANFKYRNNKNYQRLKDDTPQCGTYDDPLLTYFRNKDVQTALHIKSTA